MPLIRESSKQLPKIPSKTRTAFASEPCTSDKLAGEADRNFPTGNAGRWRFMLMWPVAWWANCRAVREDQGVRQSRDARWRRPESARASSLPAGGALQKRDGRPRCETSGGDTGGKFFINQNELDHSVALQRPGTAPSSICSLTPPKQKGELMGQVIPQDEMKR